MSNLEYSSILETDDSSYAVTYMTDDMTGYTTTVIIQTNTDCTAKIQYSTDDGDTWSDLSGYDAVDVNDTTYTVDLNQGGNLRVGIKNDGAGITDTVTIKFIGKSGSPTYCSAVDVARKMQLWTASTSARLVFSTTTFPTLTEVNQMILEKEDYIDEVTNHSWRLQRDVNEYHNYESPTALSMRDRRNDYQSVKLKRRSIRAFKKSRDKLEVWDGSNWYDYVLNYTEDRGNDYWVNYTDGLVYFKNRRPTRTGSPIRVSYNWGEETVPYDIRDCCSSLVAIDLLLTSDYHTSTPDGVDADGRVRFKVEQMQNRADRILEEHKEVIMVVTS